MAHQARVLIIVPAFNEAESLPTLLQDLANNCPQCDVVVVDDGSTDGTAAVVSGLPGRLVRLCCNLGIGGAVQTGLRIALEQAYEFAIQVDADGQHPPDAVMQLHRALLESDCDLVVGSRFIEAAGYHSTILRRVGIRFFSNLLSTICHTRLSDPTSGFRAMNQNAIQILARYYAEDYPEVEALVTLHKAGLKIGEFPVRMAARQGGRSSIGILQALSYMLKVPLAIVMTLLRGTPAAPGVK